MKCKMRISGIKFNTCRRQKVTSFICLQLFAESGNTHSACRCHPCAVLHCVCVLAWSLAVSVITWDDVVLTLLLLFSCYLSLREFIGSSICIFLLPCQPVRRSRIEVTSSQQILFCLAGTLGLHLLCGAGYIVKLRDPLIVYSVTKDGFGIVEHISHERRTFFNLRFNFSLRDCEQVKNFKLWFFTVTLIFAVGL